MNKLKRLFWPVMIVAYLATRLTNLTILPIFTDEAIYSYWAQIALHDPVNRFVSLEDGKQPLFIWLGAVLQNFVADPLVAMRLVSVISGLFSMFGIYLLAKTLFDKKTAAVASVLYLLLPFTLLYDRMALYDSFLTALGIYSVYFAVRIAKTPRLDLAIINGVILGLGQITKSSANVFLYMLPASLLLFDMQKKDILKRISKWAIFTAFAGILSIFIYNLLRVSPLFYMIGRKNLEFIRSYADVLRKPFQNFEGNFDSIATWFIDYNGIPLMAIFLISVVWGLSRKNRSVMLLSLYIAFPLAIELFFNKVLYSRFALFYFPYVLILIAFGATEALKIKKIPAVLVGAVMLLFISQPVQTSYKLLTDPPNAKITQADKNQYINQWPAGYGVKEVVAILNEESKDKKVYVATEGTFGLLPFAFKIYFYANDNIQIDGFWPLSDIPKPVLEKSKTTKTYLVYNEKQDLPDSPGNPHLKFIAKYQKGNGKSYMRLYEVLP